jgi:hypothetical protein
MNATVLPQYALAMDTLRPVLHNLPGKIVGIDGRCVNFAQFQESFVIDPTRAASSTCA